MFSRSFEPSSEIENEKRKNFSATNHTTCQYIYRCCYSQYAKIYPVRRKSIFSQKVKFRGKIGETEAENDKNS